MKKLLSIILTLLIVTAVGCGNGMEKKAMDQAKLALGNKEYDKASASFQLVLDENSKNEEARKIKEIIDTYLESKKSLDSNKLDDANTTIDKIDDDYSNYSINGDVNSLKTDIKNKISLRDKMQNDIAKAESLVNEKKYDEAKTIIEKLNKNDLDEIQKSKVNELLSTIATELAKINEVKQMQAKKTLTQEEARNLIIQADGNQINKALSNSGYKLDFYKKYTKEEMPFKGSWNIEPEATFHYILGNDDMEICEYLVGMESKHIYLIPNQGLTPAYQIANNQKVKKYEWIGQR